MQRSMESLATPWQRPGWPWIWVNIASVSWRWTGLGNTDLFMRHNETHICILINTTVSTNKWIPTGKGQIFASQDPWSPCRPMHKSVWHTDEVVCYCYFLVPLGILQQNSSGCWGNFSWGKGELPQREGGWKAVVCLWNTAHGALNSGLCSS